MKFVSLKTALLLALTAAKRGSVLQALSIQLLSVLFAKVKVCFKLNPAFVSKVVESGYRCP